MSDNKNNKDTDRDVRPARGQESNENWDDSSEQPGTDTNAGNKGTNPRRMDEETNTTGMGSSQRNKKDNVAPLDPDFEELPSEKRKDRGNNQTGPGLG